MKTHHPLPPGCALQVRDLKKSFGSKEVHRGISFDLYCNEILGLMGTSGGGKSLLLKTVAGLDKPDSGHVFFENVDITQLSERELYPIRCNIGYVFQNGALFDSLTVEENLSYPLRLHTDMPDAEIHAEVNRSLETVDMAGSNDLYPAELSGGMEKRVGLARATMMKPKIVLLDEPTAGLDPAHVALLLQNARRVKETQGLSGIFVTHDVPVALAICDRIAILHDGVVHAIGPVEEVEKSDDPVVRGILHPDYGEIRRKAA